MTCADAERALRGLGPPPVPRRTSRVRSPSWASIGSQAAAASVAAPARIARRSMSGGCCKRTADLPVMAEWIDHAAQAPPVIFLHRDDLSGTCRKRLREHRIRIRHGQDHSSRSTAQRLWTEVAMLRGLVTQPELRTSNGQPRHHRTTGILHTEDLDRPECRLVELNCSRAISNREHGRDRIHHGSPRACLCAHLSLPDHLRPAWRLEARRIINPYNE